MLNKTLKVALENNGHECSLEIQSQFIAFLNLLQQWNRVFNLTAIRNPEEMVMLHILDSLAVNPFLHGSRIIDVGTGAGLPGIPLALMNPEKEFVLLDSNSKKTRFLMHVMQELKIKNIEVVHSRCEDFCSKIGFDSILSRAFASIKAMLMTTQHFIAKKGQFLAMKGTSPVEELAEMPDHFKLKKIIPLSVKGLDAERCLVSIMMATQKKRSGHE